MTIGPDDIDPEFTKLELREPCPADSNIGFISFRNIQNHANETILEIDLLLVNGHFNSPTARNPHPGVGTLLIYLACHEGLKLGAHILKLYSLTGPAGFYRRMGMYRTAATFLDLPPVAAQPDFVGHPALLNREWLNEFSPHWKETRKGGTMVAEIRTVLGYIENKIFSQWKEVTI
ncbi:hypothetical protein WKW50_24920 [Ochrobactrum sp. GPK 3]|uniref:hypothetical protein n=1 Tax=Brucella sp. 22210 TaxID=3453892 RepID=UPI0031385989